MGNCRKHHVDSSQIRVFEASSPVFERIPVPYLIEAVKNDIRYVDRDKDAMLQALKALAPSEVEEALLAAMDSKDSNVREWATNRLAEIDN